MDIDSNMQLMDSEILKIEKGPLAWAEQRQQSVMHIDQFTKDLTEQFAGIGLGVDVQVWSTTQANTYEFHVEIQRRLGSVFDGDRQVHEVVNNILEIPGGGGWIDTNKALRDQERKNRDHGHRHG